MIKGFLPTEPLGKFPVIRPSFEYYGIVIATWILQRGSVGSVKHSIHHTSSYSGIHIFGELAGGDIDSVSPVMPFDK